MTFRFIYDNKEIELSGEDLVQFAYEYKNSCVICNIIDKEFNISLEEYIYNRKSHRKKQLQLPNNWLYSNEKSEDNTKDLTFEYDSENDILYLNTAYVSMYAVESYNSKIWFRYSGLGVKPIGVIIFDLHTFRSDEIEDLCLQAANFLSVDNIAIKTYVDNILTYGRLNMKDKIPTYIRNINERY